MARLRRAPAVVVVFVVVVAVVEIGSISQQA
jgi:hypothetical protein